MSPGTSRKLSKRAIDQIAARREDRLITTCGCVVFPDAIIRVLGEERTAWCDQHGQVSIDHVMTGRERIIHALELSADWQPPDPAEPPY